MAAHFPNRNMFTLQFHQHIQVPQHRCFSFRKRRRGRNFFLLQVAGDLPENPDVPASRPTDHDTIAPGFSQQSFRIVHRPDIAITNYRYVDGSLDLPDNLPIRVATIKLFAGPSMNGNCADPSLFRPLGDFDGINGVLVPASPNFHGNGNIDRCDHCLKNSFRQFGETQQG